MIDAQDVGAVKVVGSVLKGKIVEGPDGNQVNREQKSENHVLAMLTPSSQVMPRFIHNQSIDSVRSLKTDY